MAILLKAREIVTDILGIIYLHLFGIYTFISLPFRSLLPGKQKCLDNEIILVVGATTDLGKEISRQLGMTKAKLILWDSSESLTAFAEELRKGDAEVFDYHFDLSDRRDIEAISDEVKREIGDVTIIINVTNPSPMASLLSQRPADIEKTFNSNLLSQFWITKKFLQKMIEKNHGHFVAIGSQADSWGTGNCVPDFSSKCGVRGFLQSLEDEVRHHLGNPDIKFTIVYPSHLRTSTFAESDNGIKLRFPSLFPVISNKYVATEIVQGFRRNREIIYVPGSFGVLIWLESWVPAAFSQKMQSFFLQNLDRNLRHA